MGDILGNGNTQCPEIDFSDSQTAKYGIFGGFGLVQCGLGLGRCGFGAVNGPVR